MNRVPRKIKKRRKNEERDRLVKEIMSEVLIKQLDKHYQETLPEIFPILRLPPMTDDQKKAVMEERGGTFEVITIEEAIERYDLTEEEKNAIKSHYLSDKGVEVKKPIQPFTDPPL